MIEDGIPVPPRSYRKPRTEAGIEARQMKIGQSRFCESTQERDTMRSTIRLLGGRYETRVGIKDGKQGYRVWRIG